MTHELKIMKRWFEDVQSGKKNFEIRRSDRDFKVGDLLLLQEYDHGKYTGREITREVEYIYKGDGTYGVSDMFWILGLKQEPCDDAVRRETVRDMFCEIHCHNERSKCAFRNICKYMNHVSALPPVTPLPDKIDGMLEDAYEHGYQQAKYDYEVQPCEDAVKRESVLNTLDTMDKALDEDRTVEAYKELLKECYKALPPVTPKQRWIPVSEELPKEPFGCFVTVEEDDRYFEPQRVIYPDIVGYDGESWNDATGRSIAFEVIAWMPLPEPYKAEGEDKE